MWILGITVGHNGSACLFNDSEIIFHIEEERLSRVKYDSMPFLAINLCYKYTGFIDHLVITHVSDNLPFDDWSGDDIYTAYVRKKQPKKDFRTHFFGSMHHKTHAATAFRNSGFQDCAVIVVDGAGSMINPQEIGYSSAWEVESIWTASHPYNLTRNYINYGANNSCNTKFYDETENEIQISDAHGIVKSYEAVTSFLGFHPIEAGKIMGLSPYGKENPGIKISNGRFNNRALIQPGFPATNHIFFDLESDIGQYRENVSWHTDPSKISDYHKDLAYAVQKSAEERVMMLIEKAIDITKKDKIAMGGGFALNCVANYKYLKKFPNIKFYHEPNANDAGNCLGVSRMIYSEISNDAVAYPLKSLYLGPVVENRYDEPYLENFDVSESTAAEVAKLLFENNIVAIFQGRSESGPRALGNRSILFNPTVDNGKEIINEVKNREWFRPFAGSCLLEYAKDWFDMASLEESPFMMYAVDVLEEKRELIPAIVHEDGTCRVQTVTWHQNTNFYRLIDEFFKLSGVPILFNTSFNLAGDPLCETLKDALETLEQSKIDYLWLPELDKIVCKRK